MIVLLVLALLQLVVRSMAVTILVVNYQKNSVPLHKKGLITIKLTTNPNYSELNHNEFVELMYGMDISAGLSWSWEVRK